MKTYYKTKDRREFFQKQYEIQDGKCMICGQKERLVIDHNHSNGELRGLLCYSHNAGLGMFQDNPELLEIAGSYLRRFGFEREVRPETLDARRMPVEHRDVIRKLLNDPCFSSDRARSRELATLVGISEASAQARISRARRRLSLRVSLGEAPCQNP